MEKLNGFNNILRQEREGIVNRCVQDAKNKLNEIIINELESKAQKMIEDIANGAGIPLSLRNIKDKTTTLEDFDAALTEKINRLAGTDFASLKNINRERIAEVAANKLGERLGIGSLYPVDNFRAALSDQLVNAFDGNQPSNLFGADVVIEIERRTALGFAEIKERTKFVGNVASSYGPPVDAAHAAKRAANRKRQADYKKKHQRIWVQMGTPIGGQSGNGREGLTGVQSGNAKPICDKNYVYKPSTT